jgi:hypothetical protein
MPSRGATDLAQSAGKDCFAALIPIPDWCPVVALPVAYLLSGLNIGKCAWGEHRMAFADFSAQAGALTSKFFRRFSQNLRGN